MQSEAMCPAPPHLVHTVVLVMLRVSVLCHGLRILGRATRVIQRLEGVHFNLIRGRWDPPDRLSSSRRVPLSRASSRSCILRRSFWSSGVSMPCFRMFLIWEGAQGVSHRGGLHL